MIPEGLLLVYVYVLLCYCYVLFVDSYAIVMFCKMMIYACTHYYECWLIVYVYVLVRYCYVLVIIVYVDLSYFCWPPAFRRSWGARISYVERA